MCKIVGHEGEVLESFATKHRDRMAAQVDMKRTMKRYGRPRAIVTDRLCSYGGPKKAIGTPSKKRRTREFEKPTNDEVEKIEVLVVEAFDGFDAAYGTTA